jgi:hypothetical protein
MIFGHNTNIALGAVKYHVQTEDAGIASALIDTTVYSGGRVLHRRTNSYLDLLPLNADREEALKLRLDEQHRQVIEEIRSGALYLPPPAVSQSRPPSPFASASHTHEFGATAEQRGTATEPKAEVAPVERKDAPATPAAQKTSPSGPPPVLSLELRNPKSWLIGKRATLQIRVTDRAAEPVRDARITASISGAAEPAGFYAETDGVGEAQLAFDMPRLGDAAVVLVIEAIHGDAQGALRFQLRARQRVPVG